MCGRVSSVWGRGDLRMCGRVSSVWGRGDLCVWVRGEG